MTPLDFSTLSDAQINAAVAEAEGRLTDWYCHKCKVSLPPTEVTFDERHDGRYGGCGEHVTVGSPPYATSCDECVRLLDSCEGWSREMDGQICIWKRQPTDHTSFYTQPEWQAKESNFCRSALLAWGRAKGVFA
jgi:hypothetical protein